MNDTISEPEGPKRLIEGEHRDTEIDMEAGLASEVWKDG
jgi:hypothetical protein